MAADKCAVSSNRLLTALWSERRALMRADAVLRCVAVAVEYGDSTCDQPDYADAIEGARDLIARSIERLESNSHSPSERTVAYNDQDDGEAEALRRDAGLDAHPEQAISFEELDTSICSRHE